MANGRPTKYNNEFHPTVAEAWAKTGATDEELAEKLKIDVSTLYRWKNKHEEFCESIKKGKKSIDDRVENALLRRALGYEHKEDKIFQYEGHPLIVPTIKHYAPDTAALIFWLKNRRPALWRDKQELQHGGDITLIFDEDDKKLMADV